MNVGTGSFFGQTVGLEKKNVPELFFKDRNGGTSP